MTVTDIILIIGVLTTSIVTILNAYRGEQRGKQAVTAAEGVATLAVSAAKDVAAVVKARSDVQDQKRDEIHEATNGGVQALRDRVVVGQDRIAALEKLLKTALAELQAERAKPS